MQGSGFGIEDKGGKGSGLRVNDLRFRVKGYRFRVHDLRFRV